MTCSRVPRPVFCAVISGYLLVSLPAAAVAAGCDATNGNRFNLEPRANAVIQNARSVAVLADRVAPGVDLVVATAADVRSLGGSPDAFYVQRSGANCAPDFEGGPPFISNPINLFAPFGSSTVVADPARDAFFFLDLRFATEPDVNAIGIVRTTATTLMDPGKCPNGTEPVSASCWTVGAVANVTSLNAFLSDPHIAIDPHTSGTGAGDVYAVVTQRSPTGSSTHISLTACTNAKLTCGSSISVSGSDGNADFSFVQVRPDGAITISYRDTSFPGIHPEDIKFVVCTPNGAPNPPTCAPPLLVLTESNPIFAATAGDVPLLDELYPRHVHRLESDGHSLTTFLVYDRCEVALLPQAGAGGNFCPKTGIALTHSLDGGQTWSEVTPVSTSPGQQFFAAPAVDLSTSTVDIAFYSTENDFFQQKPQVFLARILPGSTTVQLPQLITTGSADVRAGPPILTFPQPPAFGDRLGIAAAGSGPPGASRAYVGFTWNSVNGNYGGVPGPDVNNHLTAVTY